MKLLRRNLLLLAAGLTLSVTPALFAQSEAQQPPQQGEQKSAGGAVTMTGCLNKDASGGFVLTDESTGAKMMVTGVSDLEKHSSNHKVTLTGTAATNAGGQTVFQATKLQHVSDSCKAGSQ
jgi:hypothetical protein